MILLKEERKKKLSGKSMRKREKEEGEKRVASVC